MMERPRIENAPGTVWRLLKSGWECRWLARTDLVDRGFVPRVTRLWLGHELTDLDIKYIQDRANAMQDEMLVWGRGGIPVNFSFDGTLDTLADCYQHDEFSNFKKLEYKTREHYSSLLRRIKKDRGSWDVKDIKAKNLIQWHEIWTESGVSIAHSLVGMLRTLFGFGMTILEDDQCERLTVVLSKLRFKQGKPRTAHLTADHAIAIRAEAHRRGWSSFALAQAFQFECILRQKDVIGEWIPLTEPRVSDIISGNSKWVKGIRWQEIDANLIMRHTTSKRGKDVEIDLKLAPMVMEEFRHMLGLGADAPVTRDMLPPSGPIIVWEKNAEPFRNALFRRDWRKLADACDVPKGVRNMDTRSGAITEALAAGAPLDSVRKSATHSDASMTQRYSRGDAEASAEVAKFRIAGRNKTGTDGR